jgi:hypothetical protein
MSAKKMKIKNRSILSQRGKTSPPILGLVTHHLSRIILYRLVTRHLSLVTFLFVICHLSLLTTYAQRDYFTAEEVEMIRDAQQIDTRIDTLVKIIDRRFAAAGIEVGGAKISAKDADKWGTLTGTHSDYLFDIKRILQKAIDDIDNLAERPDSMVIEAPDPKDKNPKKPPSFGDLFPKAVRKLAAAAERYKGPLNNALTATKDEKDRGSILDSIDMCDEIITSVAKLSSAPKPAKN